ncbi:hypothetical protein MMC34_007995 [Xylographa carneopallida]|nr:hypothetical protein [Xylographa carneopallida]
MHFSSLTVLCGFVAAAAAATTSACNADNCLRAVRASSFPTRSGAADCSSYFAATVTPATSTITQTATVTSFANKRRRALNEAEGALAPRQVTVVPSAIPTYASACSGSVRYSSACSCIGVTATTSTAATPLTTVTVTVTASVTKPTVAFTGFYGQNCDAGTENGDDGSFVEGECVSLPDQISIEEDGFSAGSSTGLTAADCTITFYSDSGCTIVEHTAPATPGCQFVGFDFSGELTCAAAV